MKPLALVTNEVPDYRLEPFRLLAEAERVEVLAWSSGRVTQREAARLVGSGRYRAVIAGLGGRLALPGSYAAARRARIPFVLWASMWSHPRTPAHLLSRMPMNAIYRGADAVATYGPHVSRFVEERRGPAGNVFEAAQAVDARVFGREVSEPERAAARERAGAGPDGFLVLFSGRLVHEKGVAVLLEAWRRASLPEGAALAFAGEGPIPVEGPGVHALGRMPRDALVPLYAAADALVLPSVRTATFTEPWGLVVNEAMHQGTPVITSDAVGAAAGGLVRDGRNGLVAPAADASALATRIEALARNPELRERLGNAAREDVRPYTPEAWVSGMRRAIAAAGAGHAEEPC